MLAYLDSLIAALAARDASDIERLLAHPLSRILPAEARREAENFREGQCDDVIAPLRVMQLRHQTAELLGVSAVAERGPAYSVPSVKLSPPSRARTQAQLQMELPLSA